jgi:benzoylformate decarboxylase
VQARGPRSAHSYIAAIATGMTCASRRISTHDELIETLDEIVPTLRTRSEPLLLDVRIS